MKSQREEFALKLFFLLLTSASICIILGSVWLCDQLHNGSNQYMLNGCLLPSFVGFGCWVVWQWYSSSFCHLLPSAQCFWLETMLWYLTSAWGTRSARLKRCGEKNPTKPCPGTEKVVMRKNRERIQGETRNHVVPDSAGGT